MNVELVEDPFEVVANGMRAESESDGDRLVGETLRGQQRHGGLATLEPKGVSQFTRGGHAPAQTAHQDENGRIPEQRPGPHPTRHQTVDTTPELDLHIVVRQHSGLIASGAERRADLGHRAEMLAAAPLLEPAARAAILRRIVRRPNADRLAIRGATLTE
jgi:hypothetical protein